MSRFDDLGSAYLASPLMHQFGETATYRPRGAPARSITVIVAERGRDEQGLFAIVEAKLHATLGVSMDELNRGDDQIDLAFERPTDAPTRRRIAQFTEPLGGMVTLEIR